MRGPERVGSLPGFPPHPPPAPHGTPSQEKWPSWGSRRVGGAEVQQPSASCEKNSWHFSACAVMKPLTYPHPQGTLHSQGQGKKEAKPNLSTSQMASSPSRGTSHPVGLDPPGIGSSCEGRSSRTGKQMPLSHKGRQSQLQSHSAEATLIPDPTQQLRASCGY